METKKRALLEEENSENLVAEDSFDNVKAKEGKKSETEDVQSKPSKKAKTERIWSEEEEIAILNAAIKFSKETTLDPAVNKIEFFAFTRDSKSLCHDFSRTEVAMKVKRLKKKFFGNLCKGKTVSSVHEARVFELSTGIWGASIPPKRVTNDDKMNEMCSSFLKDNLGGVGESIVEEAMKHVGEATRKEFVEQWKEIQIMELELSLKTAELVEFTTQTILEEQKPRI